MYAPAAFREQNEERLQALLQVYPFATVVTHTPAGVCANHLPFEVCGSTLRGHVARGNELARFDGAPVLVIFSGAHGYVSPNWYPGKHDHGRAVPTWNYAVAHVHGRLRVVEDRAWLRALLEALTQRHEAGETKPWRVSDAPADYVDQLLGAIVGIEVDIERIEGKFKLSQNHPAANREGVIAGLERRGATFDAELVSLMRQV